MNITSKGLSNFLIKSPLHDVSLAYLLLVIILIMAVIFVGKCSYLKIVALGIFQVIDVSTFGKCFWAILILRYCLS